MSGSLLDDILARYRALPPEKQEALRELAEKDIAERPWVPNHGPQLNAFNSQADILLYGGQAGGGKSDLILGLALTAHKKSLILRREYNDLGALTDRAVEMNGTRNGFNGANPPKLRTKDGRMIEFGAAQREGDEIGFQGRPHDLLGYDEAWQFTEMQVRHLIAWVRSIDPNQRTRVILASNPPVTVEGEWMVRFFAPWLDPNHANPAKPGELRWFVSDEDGNDLEVPGPELYQVGERMVRPLSRTFIPSSLRDNPFLARTDYGAKLDALPEPYRSAYRDGNFMLARKDSDRQVIPTQWVREAQARWTPKPPPGVPMCTIGVDVAAGGDDNTVLSPRHDAWFAPLLAVPGVRTPLGSDVAGLIISHRRDQASVAIDMGGGYGGAAFEWLLSNGFEDGVDLFAYKGAEGARGRTIDNKLGFTNKRSESYWRVRELLDPSQLGGSPCALPPDPELVADLTAPTFKITPRGIQVEPKEDVVKRLRRSPDRGDAVVCTWSCGPKVATHGEMWRADQRVSGRLGRTPRVVMGHQAARR